MLDIVVNIPKAHPKQQAFIDSKAKRKVVRAGRRGGKTVGVAIMAVRAFLEGKRVLYAAPTQDQIDRFWHEIKLALDDPIKKRLFYKNETKHLIERRGTEQRIRAKTAWNADSLRGDYADLLILDEWQLMHEEAWDRVGAPMMMDHDGDAVFIYTPPSPRSRSASKAVDPRHASKLFKKATRDTTGRWETFHFSSHDNPYISQDAVNELAIDMSALSYRMEILAIDSDEVPGALWNMLMLDASRWEVSPEMHRIAVGLDPAASAGQTGIVVSGVARVNKEIHGFVLDDFTTPFGAKPDEWASAAVDAYHRNQADVMVGEINNGGDMIEAVIRGVPGGKEVNYKCVRATRGKYTRAEPVATLFASDEDRRQRARCHMVGQHPELEDECCSWVPGDDSPNRLDAMVWAFWELILNQHGPTMQVAHDSANLYGSRGRVAGRSRRNNNGRHHIRSGVERR